MFCCRPNQAQTTLAQVHRRPANQPPKHLEGIGSLQYIRHQERDTVCIHCCKPRMRTSEQADEGQCHWHLKQSHAPPDKGSSCLHQKFMPVKRVQKSV